MKNKNSIPFIDLAAQQKQIFPELEKRIKKVLSHGKYIMGPEVAELEEKLAEYVGVRHAISCSSGTDALLISLMADGVGPGDAVFTTPFTFIATAEVIALLGAIPVFVDIDPRTFNIDPSHLEAAIKAVKENDPSIYPLPRTFEFQPASHNQQLSPKAIIAVDLFGLPADYQRINDIAREDELFVIEDGAQSFGATCRGEKACALADVAATSFFPAKPLSCYGDGGAAFTDRGNLAAKIKSIRLHGKGEEKYDNIRLGINGRLDTLQAAILLAKLEIFPHEIDARNRIAEKYSNALQGIVEVPVVPSGSTTAWAQYSVLSDGRSEIQTELKNEGIPTAVYYPKPLHLQTAFDYLCYKKGDFPIAEKICERIFSLPMHPYLKNDQIDRITQVMKTASGRRE